LDWIKKGPQAENNFFPLWSDINWSRPTELGEHVTWPLAGYVPDSPDILFGFVKRWPCPPWPEEDLEKGGDSCSSGSSDDMSNHGRW